MANVDVIKQGFAQQNNYNGAKIVVHNPTVNVPPQVGYAKPDYAIYQYPEGKISSEYYQAQLPVSQNQTKTSQVPDAKVVPVEPVSVLENVKTVAVPPPVYVEENVKTVEKTPVENAQEQKSTVVVETTPDVVVKRSEQQPAPTVQPVEVAPVKDEISPEVVAPKKSIEIIEPMVPPLEVDYIKVCSNLESADYDVQALQLKDIVDAAATSVSAKNFDAIKPYHVEQIFIDIIDIVNKDTSSLAGPTDAQLQIRDKIVENYMASVEQNQKGVQVQDIVLPHQLTKEDINYANMLAPKELAERNRDYAIATLAVISKTFVDRVESETGTNVPITDVPGLSAIVNALKNPTYTTRLTALDALNFLQKPEYARELTPIYDALIRTDADENVRAAANFVLENLNRQIEMAQNPQMVA